MMLLDFTMSKWGWRQEDTQVFGTELSSQKPFPGFKVFNSTELYLAGNSWVHDKTKPLG